MQAVPAPQKFEDWLVWYANTLCLAAYKSGREAGVLHAIGDHEAENNVAAMVSEQMVMVEEHMRKVGMRLDGFIEAEAIASGAQDVVIPGDWKPA